MKKQRSVANSTSRLVSSSGTSMSRSGSARRQRPQQPQHQHPHHPTGDRGGSGGGTVNWDDLKKRVEREKSVRAMMGGSDRPAGAGAGAGDGPSRDHPGQDPSGRGIGKGTMTALTDMLEGSKSAAGTAPSIAGGSVRSRTSRSRATAAGRSTTAASTRERVEGIRARLNQYSQSSSSSSFRSKKTSAWQTYQTVDRKRVDRGGGTDGPARGPTAAGATSVRSSTSRQTRSRPRSGRNSGPPGESAAAAKQTVPLLGSSSAAPISFESSKGRAQNQPRRRVPFPSAAEQGRKRRQEAIRRSQSAPRQRSEPPPPPPPRPLPRQQQPSGDNSRQQPQERDEEDNTSLRRQQPVSILKKNKKSSPASDDKGSIRQHRPAPSTDRVRSNSADSIGHHLWGPPSSSRSSSDLLAAGRPTSYTAVARAAAGTESSSRRRTNMDPNGVSRRGVLGMKNRRDGFSGGGGVRNRREAGRTTADDALVGVSDIFNPDINRHSTKGDRRPRPSPSLAALEGEHKVEFENLPGKVGAVQLSTKSSRNLRDGATVYTAKSGRTIITTASEFSLQRGEEEANERMARSSSIGNGSKFVTFFEEESKDDDDNKDDSECTPSSSLRSITTELSEDVVQGHHGNEVRTSTRDMLLRSDVQTSTRSLESSPLDVTTIVSNVGESTIISGAMTDTTEIRSNLTGHNTGDGGVPTQIRGGGGRHRRHRERSSQEEQTQSSGEEAKEAPRRANREPFEEGGVSRFSIDDMAWKYSASPFIYLGGVINIESTSENNGNFSASRMHEGMVLSARQRSNYRSTLFDLGQEDEEDDHDAEGSGCLVLEGPPPSTAPNTINSEEQQQQLWWTVRVPVRKPGAEDNDDANVDEANLPVLDISSVDDIREGHSVVALFLKSGRFADAVHFLYNTVIVALRSRPEIQEEWNSSVGGGDLINMALRNIGTIEVWMGRLQESSHSLYHVVNREEDSSSEENIVYHRPKKAFDSAASLVLLGLSLYAQENYEEANSVFIKSLSSVNDVIQRRLSDSSGSIDSLDDNDFVYTAGKVLNNIGCVFFELGFYRSACRALHRSLLVFMSKNLECGCPPLSLDGPLEGHSPPFPSLTELMNGIKAKRIKIENLPAEHKFDVSASFNNLAILLVKRGKYSAASVCVNSAESILSEALGQYHPVSYSTMEGKAYLNIKMHRYERALRVYEQMLEIEEKRGVTSSVGHLTIAKLLGKMSFAYLKMHKNRAALACLKGVLANQEAALPPDDASIAQTKSFMADIKARIRKEREDKESRLQGR